MPIANRVRETGVVVAEPGLDQPPGVDREPVAAIVDRRWLARHASVSLEVVDDDVRPGRAECVAVAAPVDPDHQRELAGAPGGDAGDGVLDDDRPCRRDAEQLGGVGEHRRVGLARRDARSTAVMPSTTARTDP